MKYFTLILLMFSVIGCAPVVFLGGSAAATKTATQEKSVGSSVDDFSIWMRIKGALFKQNNNYSATVSSKVEEGRVLLTGTVENQEQRLDVLKIVWSQKGVKEVINELVTKDEQDGISRGNYAKDSWITTQIKSKLFFNNNVKSVNYNVETIAGIVYLIGIAQDEQELDIVTNVAGSIKNVQRVVSYVRIKDSEIRQEMLKKIQ